MNVTEKEKNSLKSFIPLCRKLPKNWDDGTGLRVTHNHAENVEEFFNSRGIKVKFNDPCFASFQSVGMHVDGINPENWETLIVPIRGAGHLNHFIEGKIKTSYFYPLLSPSWRMIRLDDSKPHSFITKGTCHALLLGVEKEKLNQFVSATPLNFEGL